MNNYYWCNYCSLLLFCEKTGLPWALLLSVLPIGWWPVACPLGGAHLSVGFCWLMQAHPLTGAPLGPPHVVHTSSQKDGETEAAGAFSAGLRTDLASLSRTYRSSK